jgi:hypothetical protein
MGRTQAVYARELIALGHDVLNVNARSCSGWRPRNRLPKVPETPGHPLFWVPHGYGALWRLQHAMSLMLT